MKTFLLNNAKRIVLVAALLSILIALDWYQRNRELDQLLTNVEASSELISKTNQRLDGFNSRIRSGGGSSVREEAGEEAGTARAQLILTKDSVGSLWIAPWHMSLRKASDDYISHLESFAQRYEDWEVQRNSSVADSEITSRYALTARAVQDAAPPFAMYKIDSRLKDLFGENEI